MRVVAGDLVVEPGAGQGEDVNGGGRGLLPARAPGGQRLGLTGAVIGRHRPDQEAFHHLPDAWSHRGEVAAVASRPDSLYGGVGRKPAP